MRAEVTQQERWVTLVSHQVTRTGGMERALAELADRLLERGWRVRVIARRCELEPHPRLSWIRVPSPNRPFMLAYPLFFAQAAVTLSRYRKGIVHSLGAIVLSRADAVTVQFCHHGFDAAAAKARSSRQNPLYHLNARAALWMSRAAERWCYRPSRTRMVIPASRGVQRELQRAFPPLSGKMQVIPNGVDREAFNPSAPLRSEVRAELGLAEEELAAVFVGGDWERKGLRFAIEALANSDWRLIVVGDGDADRYRELAAEVGAEARVTFMGKRPDVVRFFGAADAFVLPTAYEAFPLVMLEAAASGLPVIVTRVNGSEDFVEDGVNGFFIERNANAIAGRLDDLTQLGTEGRRRLGAAARGATELYTWERITDAHESIYQALLEGLPDALPRGEGFGDPPHDDRPVESTLV